MVASKATNGNTAANQTPAGQPPATPHKKKGEHDADSDLGSCPFAQSRSGGDGRLAREILGGEIIRGPGRIDVKLGGANVFIAPVAAGDGVNTPPVTPYQGLDHFGLTVKDIDAVAAEIKAKGVEFTKEPTTIRPGVRICFIRGPQGISVELLERDKKYA